MKRRMGTMMGLILAMGLLLFAAAPVETMAGSWSSDWNYYMENGKKVTGWKKISGKWYFFSKKTGKMSVGVKKIKGQTYFFKRKKPHRGEMASSQFVTINGKKRYFQQNGAMILPNKYMALTFDDGPGRYTDSLLNTLNTYDAHATFFVLGQLAGSYPAELKKMTAIGCQIGNHSYDHANLVNVSNDGILNELSMTANKIAGITGVTPQLVRPPYGSINSRVRAVIPLPMILWSVDTLDWKTKNTQSTINAVLTGAGDGDVVLMHDIHAPTVSAAQQLIPELIKRGYRLVTVSELAKAKGYALKRGVAYGAMR